MPIIWQAIANEPQLVPNAVREVIRLWPRSISTSRTALEDTTIEDVELPTGASVFASFGVSYRQADVFDEPEEFRLNRDPFPEHMNFGGG